MKVVVIGGSGATGKFLIEKMLATDWISEITVLLRRKAFADHPKLKQVIVDFDKLSDWSNDIQGDVAFSCMGTTLKTAGSKKDQWTVDYDYQYNFAQLARENKIPIFVLLSSQNAKADSSFFYLSMKGKLEQSIEKLAFSKLIIHQPGMLERPGTDRFAEKFSLKPLKFFNKLGLFKQFAPTHVSIVANAMIQSIKSAQPGLARLNLTDIVLLGKNN